MNNVLKTRFYDLKLAFVDCETTGLSIIDHELIEIAAVIYNQKSDKIEREYSSKIKPINIKTASPDALKITGYTSGGWIKAISLEKALNEFNDFVKGCIIAGQCVHFDLKFIDKSMRALGIVPKYDRHIIDTASLIWPMVKKTRLNSISLKSMCDYFGVSNDGAHSALPDARRTCEVYRHIMKLYQ